MPSPSFEHELPLTLFRECPQLLPELLQTLPELAVPVYCSIHMEDSNLSEPLPPQYRADLVMALRGADDRPRLGLVLEVQRSIDVDKLFSWPVYVAVTQARLQAPVWLVVITDDPRVAAWASQAIALSPGSVSYPLVVIGPDRIPRVSLAQARKLPELGLLSAAIHGNAPGGLAIVHAALEAISGLDENRRTYYWDLLWWALSQTTRRFLEAQMQAGTYQYRSDFARTYFAQGKAEGEARGRAEGQAEGRAEGQAEGEARGRAEAILAVLKARHVPVQARQRKRILECRDLPTLDHWLARAALATTVREVFETPEATGPQR